MPTPRQRDPRAVRLRPIFGPDPAAEVDEELAFHLDTRTAELAARGVPAARARELAAARFGDPDGPRRECIAIAKRRHRRMLRAETLSELRQDAAFALRTLRKQPAFTLIAVLTLALGIGADTAIFSVVRGVLLRPLPYAEPERLMEVRTAYPNGQDYTLSAPDFMSVATLDGVFDGVAAMTDWEPTWTGEGEPRTVAAAELSRGFLATLGVGIVLGRGFDDDEHLPGRTQVAILSHRLWQSRFGGRDDVLGRTLTLSGQPYRVIGVASPHLDLPAGTEIYLPLEHGETFDATTAQGRRSEFLFVVARRAPEVGPERAEAALADLGRRLQQEFPDTNDRLTFTAYPLVERFVGEVRQPLLVLLGAVGLVLLIACVNVANLLLARAATRQDELALRNALGAGRGRLLRQLLTEALVLGLAGGLAGLLLAWLGTRALIATVPEVIPRLEEVGVDGPVALFSFALGLATALLAGLLPALHATRGGLAAALKEGGRGGDSGRRHHRLRHGLIVAETALAVVLLVGAGLLLRSFLRLTAVDPGFDPERAITFTVSLQGAGYDELPSRVDAFGRLLERLEALPGVLAAGGANVLPLDTGGAIESLDVDGRAPDPDEVLEIRTAWVTPGYFRALGTPVIAGRPFGAGDREGAPLVTVINQAAVERWFDGESPLGRRLGLRGEPREVVGVVADLPQLGLDRPAEPVAYYPHAQLPGRTISLVVRSEGDPAALVPEVRRLVRQLDADLPLAEPQPLESLVAESVARPRFYAGLLALFASVALALALVGIFGVMSYVVAQRRREIGIRIAMGARQREVVRMVLLRALALTGGGLALGLLVALASTQALESQLYGVSATDPWTFAAVLALLAVSAAAASVVPARRAARVDPVVALRGE
jgi:putative ABC transport system permease protein